MSAKSVKKHPNNSIHFTLQGKGGVGKSLVSSLLAQYFNSIDGCTVKCVDTIQLIKLYRTIKHLMHNIFNS